MPLKILDNTKNFSLNPNNVISCYQSLKFFHFIITPCIFSSYIYIRVQESRIKSMEKDWQLRRMWLPVMNFNTRSPVFYFTRFWQLAWLIDPAPRVTCFRDGWINESNVETSVTVAALFPAVKNRSRRGNFCD